MLSIDVWSDIACPWCFVGKRRLEGALERFGHPVQVTWRSFELNTAAPPRIDDSVPYVGRLAEKYRTTAEEAQGMLDRMTAAAAKDGIEMRFDRIAPGNTFDAHRLLHLAAAHGQQGALKERLLRAYFTEGAWLGAHDKLVELAVEAGLEAGQAREVLTSDRFAEEVRVDEGLARRIGVNGVPFFVIDGRYGVSGAQPVDVLLGILERAWREAEEAPIDEGAVCGPDGC